MNELSWWWILLMLVAPLPGAVLLARPIWHRREMILGNIAGSVVILGVALALMLRESAELDILRRRCFDAGFVVCWPTPGAFTRYAIYAAIGMVEVVLLFVLSLRVEHQIRERDYAPEWRR